MSVIIFAATLLLVILVISVINAFENYSAGNLAVVILTVTILAALIFHDFNTSFGVKCYNTPNCLEFMEARAKFLQSLKDNKDE